MGPALTLARKVPGISGKTACNRATESRVSSVSRARVGESSVACCSVTDWLRRVMEPVIDWSVKECT